MSDAAAPKRYACVICISNAHTITSCPAKCEYGYHKKGQGFACAKCGTSSERSFFENDQPEQSIAEIVAASLETADRLLGTNDETRRNKYLLGRMLGNGPTTKQLIARADDYMKRAMRDELTAPEQKYGPSVSVLSSERKHDDEMASAKLQFAMIRKSDKRNAAASSQADLCLGVDNVSENTVITVSTDKIIAIDGKVIPPNGSQLCTLLINCLRSGRATYNVLDYLNQYTGSNNGWKVSTEQDGARTFKCK